MDEADLLSAQDFRLFAVCSRFPRNLSEDQVTMQPIQPGVYEVEVLSRRLRLVVVSQLPQVEHNALLHLFSASGELFAYGARHYRIRSAETSSLLLELLHRYQQETLTMPDLLEQFTRETIDRLLRELPPEKRLEGLSPEKRLEGLSPEKRLEGLSPEKRLEGLSPEKRLEGLSAEEMLAALPPEMREALARLLQAEGTEPKPE
jgi:hypothetical protein